MSVLITAGPVYGRLDDNKIVSNRSRGIWAVEFARWLAWNKNRDVTILAADTHERAVRHQLQWDNTPRNDYAFRHMRINLHNGFRDYRAYCHEHIAQMRVAVMAAAVVNWIPAEPVEGKMTTEGYQAGDRIHIPFMLAPHVIDELKPLNPKLTLIGCKLTSYRPREGEHPVRAAEEQLITAAYKTLLGSRANCVVANDMRLGLHRKFVVHQDRTVRTFDVKEDSHKFFNWLNSIIEDEHYRTESYASSRIDEDADRLFDAIVDRYRQRFTRRLPEGDKVFGSLAVRRRDGTYLVSPREKGEAFTSKDAVVVHKVDGHQAIVYTQGGKATLNAPLLIRHLEHYPSHPAVIHLHEPDWATPDKVPYYPPGTRRDSERAIDHPAYLIKGHGLVSSVLANLNIYEDPLG